MSSIIAITRQSLYSKKDTDFFSKDHWSNNLSLSMSLPIKQQFFRIFQNCCIFDKISFGKLFFFNQKLLKLLQIAKFLKKYVNNVTVVSCQKATEEFIRKKFSCKSWENEKIAILKKTCFGGGEFRNSALIVVALPPNLAFECQPRGVKCQIRNVLVAIIFIWTYSLAGSCLLGFL